MLTHLAHSAFCLTCASACRTGRRSSRCCGIQYLAALAESPGAVRASALVPICIYFFIFCISLFGAGPVIPRLLKEACIASEGLNITAAGPNDTFAKANETAAISCASVQSGILVSLSNFATFLGAPIVGLLSDARGRRIFLMVAAASLALDLIFLAVSPSVYILYFSRPIFGFFNASMAISTAYCADLVGPANRGQAFGILGVSFGAALALGPLMTGAMAKFFAVRTALFCAGCIAASNMVLAYFLKESRPVSTPPAPIAWRKAIPLRSFGLVFHSPVATGFTLVFLLKYIADEGIIDTFPLYLDYKFQWSPLQIGVFASLLGLSVALSQGLLVPFLHLMYTERQAIVLAMILASAASFMYGLATEGWQVYIVILFRSVSLISAPLLQAQISNEFPAQILGELLGLVTSLRNLSASFGPILFNWMFAYFISPRAPVVIPSIVFYVSAVCSFAAAVVAVGIIITHKTEGHRQQEPKSPETVELTSAEGGETSDNSL